MEQNWNWRSQLRYWALFIPVTAYFFLFMLVLAILYFVTFHTRHSFSTDIVQIIQLIVQSLFYLIVLLFSFSLLSVLVPFLWLQIQKFRRRMRVGISNSPLDDGTMGPKIFLQVYPLLRPMLGFLYFRVLYDEKVQSPRLALSNDEQKENTAWGNKQGYFVWPLQGIREYPVNELIIYFEDIFHFFSLASRIPVHQSFYIKPQQSAGVEKLSISPLRIKDPEIRTEDLRRTSGEWLNFKNFEPNDDVRRIVWKHYARNKELMVRIPEIQDPTASVLNIFYSFHDDLNVRHNFILNVAALDYYKNACWTLQRQLQDEGRQVRLYYDQTIPQKLIENKAEADAYAISACQWQRNKPVDSLEIPATGTILVISSLASPRALQELQQELPVTSVVLLVRLSQIIPKPDFTKILRRIFVVPENQFEKQGYSEFRVNYTRHLLLENEQELEMILKSGINKYFLG